MAAHLEPAHGTPVENYCPRHIKPENLQVGNTEEGSSKPLESLLHKNTLIEEGWKKQAEVFILGIFSYLDEPFIFDGLLF